MNLNPIATLTKLALFPNPDTVDVGVLSLESPYS